MARVAIAGGCRCGKTTAAARYSGIVRHTDDVAIGQWDGAADAVAGWFDQPFDCIEGVAVARGLRRWLEMHPEGKPCDVVIVMLTPHVPLTREQLNMNKGVSTVLNQIAPQLEKRGVVISER